MHVCVCVCVHVLVGDTNDSVAEGVAQVPLSFAQHHGGSVVEEEWGFT